jgi:carbon-monoxide dehydrogenase medium subunit
MKPAPFKYFAPANLDQAIELLAADDQARPLAGGQSLVPMMNFRLARPSALVDLNRIPELSDIREVDGALHIGSMTRQAALLASPVLQRRAPLVTDALAFVGHPPTRARGTIGGSLANADPAAELPVVALALDAEFAVRGLGGERVIHAGDFFQGMFENAIGDGELLTEIRIAPRLPRAGHAFLEFSRRHGDFAIISVAVNLTLDNSDRCESSRIVLGGVGPIPVRCETVEAQLQGRVLNETTIDVGSDAIHADSIELESRGASRHYRLHLARVLLKRALQQARHSAHTNSR